MSTRHDRSTDCSISVHCGEVKIVSSDSHTTYKIDCDQIARFALAIQDNGYFFFQHYGLVSRFSRDLNGSGTQGLYIARSRMDLDRKSIISVYFDPVYSLDGVVLYEADLIMDQGKDYEPTVNKGRHKFMAQRAFMQVDWHDDEVRGWQSDVARLSYQPETLSEWVSKDYDMLVTCNNEYCCRSSAIITNKDLVSFVAARLSLNDLKSRLKCSECGKRNARVQLFEVAIQQ